MRLPCFSALLSRPRAIAAIAFLIVPLGAHTTLAQPKPAPLPAGPKPPPTTAPAASPSGAPRPAGPRPAPTTKSATPASSTAPAATPPEPVDAGDEVGRLYTEGYNAFQAGQYTEAEALLTKAWSLSQSFDVAGALGSTKLEMGKSREAAQYLSFALRNALPSTRAGVRDRIRRDLENAKQKLATIKLTVSLAEAKVAVDGAGLDPLFLGPEIYVDPGSRTFEATADGYTPAKSTIETKAGQIHVVSLTLERTSAPKGGGAPPIEPAERSVPLPAALLGGFGGAAIVAGAILIGAAESNKNTVNDLAGDTKPEGKPTCPKTGPGPTTTCDDLRSAAANVDAFGNAGIGVFIGAGALLAGATVYMLFIHQDPPPAAPADQKAPGPQSRIVPVVGPNGGGLLWQGSF